MKTSKDYRVTARFAHPAWDEKDGFTFEHRARSKSEAISFARREMRDAGHMGRIYFTAVEIEIEETERSTSDDDSTCLEIPLF